ncbi:MAG: TlpA disulfide reductase family protein [Lacunisphaera sp.]
MKWLKLALVGLPWFPLGLMAADAATQAQADATWRNVQALIDAGPGLQQLARDTLAVAPGPNETLERQALALREQGMAFADHFPTDPRRWDWLPVAVDTVPDYWADPAAAAQAVFEARKRGEAKRPVVAIDEAAKAAWAGRYPEMRAAYLAAPGVTAEKKANFRLQELNEQAVSGLVTRDGVGARPVHDDATRKRRARWTEELLAIAALPVDWDKITYGDRDLVTVADMIWQSMDGEEAETLRKRFAVSGNGTLAHYAAARGELMRLKTEPWPLRFTALDGATVDLAKERGHPVIVEFWAMDCVGSRRQIPKLKALDDEFHAQGLRIFGSTGHHAEEKDAMEAFLREHGMGWPQRMDRAAHKADFEHFGFTWVSNVLLLDAQGKLLRCEPSPDLAEWRELIRTELARAAQ